MKNRMLIIGKKLRRMRGKRTQEEVAKALNLSIAAISAYELGQRTPRDAVKIALSEYYGVSVGDLFFNLKTNET